MIHRPIAAAALLAASTLLLTLGGCAPGASPVSIRAYYADELESLTPGTSVATFKQVVPDARHFDTVFDGSQRIDTYRLDHLFKPDEFPAQEQTIYFFFDGDRLVRWGDAPW